MAQETITVTYKVNEDGSLGKVAKGADKAAKATDKASKATAGHNKQQKGVAGLTSNSTKGFSKMTTGITGGLVPAYATLAANVFALTAAFGLLSRNDAISKLNEGLVFTGNAAGQNLTMVADKLKEITDNAISAEQAMRATAVGVSAGFDQGQIEDLARVAKGASLALGRDMGDAMDRLIRGAAKLEPEILDELGIMVRLDDATKKYADTMGRTVGELTQFERRMAFTNAVIEDGTSKFQDIAGAINASPYSQLSAAFSDLTKSGVQLLNSALNPIISFLANNMAALGVVMASFGLTISKSLLSSLSSMAENSAKAAEATANQSVAALKGLKPNEKLGKVYNKVALSGDRRTGAIKSMIRSLNASIVSTKVDAAATAEAIVTKRQLTLALYTGTIATHQNSAAEALNMIETHGLSLAWKAHTLVLAENTATTAAAVVGTDVYTGAIIRLKGAMFATSATVKFLGAAILTYMPWIIGISLALTILGPLIMGLFSEKDDKLSKQLEKNTKRFEKFSDVIAQYGRSLKRAKNEQDSWHRTLKPLAGLIDQVNSAMKDTQIAAETDRIVEHAAALSDVSDAQIRMDTAKKEGGRSGAMSVTAASIDLTNAQATATVAETMSIEDQNTIRKEATTSLATFLVATKQMSKTIEDDTNKTVLHTDATNILNKTRERAQTILKELTNAEDKGIASSIAAQAEVQKLAQELKAGLAAYEGFTDILAKAGTLTTQKTFGNMAAEIDNVTNAVNSLNLIAKSGLGDAGAEEQAKLMMEKYGLIAKTLAIADMDEGGDTGRRVQSTKYKIVTEYTETNKETVERFQRDLTQMNLDAKSLAFEMSKTESLVVAMGKDSDYIFKDIKANAEEGYRIALEQLRLTVKGGKDENEAVLQVLEKEREILEITKERMSVLAGRAKDSGMGAGATAAIDGAGATLAIKAGSVGTGDDDMFATEDAKNLALAAQAAENAKNVLAGVATDLAAIGPEGAFMSSVIEGAMNMQVAFSTAFEVMGDKSLDMSTRVQAGLGALGSMISSLSAMSKASSDDKVRGIDDEIAAEKKRDGSSAASTAKMKSLEAKKLAVQRKAFETNKKMKMAQTVISTAMGAMAAYSSAMESIPAPFNVPVAVAMAGMVAAMGAKQLSMIASTSFQGGAGSGGGGAPSSLSIGSRSNTVDLGKGNNAGGELGYMRGESGQGTGATDFKPTPAFSGYKSKNRASGGYIVGEQGPEVFMPDTTGSIIPSGQSAGGSTNVSFNIQAMDASGVEDVLIAQKGQIIRMIREAANEHGEFFLENVREEAYQQ